MVRVNAQNLSYQRIYTYLVIFRPLNQGQSLQTKLGSVVKYDWKVLTNFQNDLIQGTKDQRYLRKTRQKSPNFVKLRDFYT